MIHCQLVWVSHTTAMEYTCAWSTHVHGGHMHHWVLVFKCLYAVMSIYVCKDFCQFSSLNMIMWGCTLILFVDSNCCLRQYCGPSRPFEMSIVDNTQKEVSVRKWHMYVQDGSEHWIWSATQCVAIAKIQHLQSQSAVQTLGLQCSWH